MELLIDFGMKLYNSLQPLVEFLSTEFEFLYFSQWPNGEWGMPQWFTITPALLLTGQGLVIFLVAKIYKFILDLIPLV